MKAALDMPNTALLMQLQRILLFILLMLAGAGPAIAQNVDADFSGRRVGAVTVDFGGAADPGSGAATRG